MADDLQTPFEWYQTFYEKRVIPTIEKDLGDIEGFFPWLVTDAPELRSKLVADWDELNSLWANRADQKSFRAACKTWYDRLMEAKKGFEAWKAKEREKASLVGKQESMVMR